MKKQHVEQYLRRYAERDYFPLSTGYFTHAVVIPIAQEDAAFLETIHSLERAAADCQARPLIICIINGRHGDMKAGVMNRELRDMLWQLGATERFDVQWSTVELSESTLLVCSRFEGDLFFGEKEGVGTARKIGCDLALAHIQSGRISSPWIRSTDADVCVPTDYFQDVHESVAALTLPFVHHPAPQSLKLYEISLRYYLLGLSFAGSPYAFHTVGSTLVIHGHDYAKVRGFPKRLAAEDFYILNKLAKTGSILRPERADLRIRHRESERAPFGTGPAVRKIAVNLDKGIDYRLYNPAIFHHLRDALSCFEEVAKTRDLRPLHAILGTFDPGWRGMESILRQSGKPDVVYRQLHSHFDAFRTLKFIHHLRDAGLPNVPWKDAWEEADFVSVPRPSEPRPDQLSRLEQSEVSPLQGAAKVLL